MNLSYETALELKNAGFPQRYEDRLGREYYMEDSSDRDHILITHSNARISLDNALDDEQLTFVPTLSELVEACGDGFECLMRQDGVWIANHANHAHGSTPEEAVARLWLALNKK